VPFLAGQSPGIGLSATRITPFSSSERWVVRWAACSRVPVSGDCTTARRPRGSAAIQSLARCRLVSDSGTNPAERHKCRRQQLPHYELPRLRTRGSDRRRCPSARLRTLGLMCTTPRLPAHESPLRAVDGVERCRRAVRFDEFDSSRCKSPRCSSRDPGRSPARVAL
jgi:hypothetical protein